MWAWLGIVDRGRGLVGWFTMVTACWTVLLSGRVGVGGGSSRIGSSRWRVMVVFTTPVTETIPAPGRGVGRRSWVDIVAGRGGLVLASTCLVGSRLVGTRLVGASLGGMRFVGMRVVGCNALGRHSGRV